MNHNYKYIIDLRTNQKINIFTNKGRQILNKYIQYINNDDPIVVISADYDSCWSILFSMSHSVYSQFKNNEKYKQLLKLLTNYIHKITKKKNIELFVGSARQSKSLDHYFRNKHLKNNIKTAKKYGINFKVDPGGFCFRDYEHLCKKKNWKLNKLLLSDYTNKVPKGTSWTNSKITISKNHFKNPVLLKIKMLELQLKEIVKKYSKNKIEFYFFDDWDIIIKGVYHFIKTKKLKIPRNINFHLIQFCQNKGFLREIKF